MKISIYKIFSNNTVLNGTLVRVHEDFGGKEQTTNATLADDDYDSEGAMQFILATVFVYSIFGVFCTLILRIKRIRGKGHHNFVQDENVSRYLKTECNLKLDGRRMKMLQECQVVSERLKEVEEKKKYIELEEELAGDFASKPKLERKQSKRKSKHKKESGLQNTIGKMGVALFYVGSKTHMTVDDNGSGSDDNLMELREEVTSETCARDNSDALQEETVVVEPPNKIVLKCVDIHDNNNQCWDSDVETTF